MDGAEGVPVSQTERPSSGLPGPVLLGWAPSSQHTLVSVTEAPQAATEWPGSELSSWSQAETEIIGCLEVSVQTAAPLLT